MITIEPEVQTLLDQYKTYKKYLGELASIERKLAKATILSQPTNTLQAEQTQLQQSLQAISDAMTFATPTIWIAYKYLAYQDEAQPISTLGDLRVHCSKKDYICTKRYTFLNAELQARGVAPLSDRQAYDDTLDLSELLAGSVLQRLNADPIFIQQWEAYEYFIDNEQVAKWENF